MRVLLLMRGVMGSGKSTWIENKGLKPYTLCPDDLRLMYQSPVLTPDGGMAISQKNDKSVWDLLFKLLEQRMERGDFTVVDATHLRASYIQQYKKLAEEYRYRVYVIDFSSIPLNEVKRRNWGRYDYKRVPDDMVFSAYRKLEAEKIPGWVKVIDYSDADALEQACEYIPHDFNQWRKIHHVGDIHGCMDPLKEYLGDGLKDDELYIFVGDLIDRGSQNAEVVEFILSIINKPNVIVLEGNHEKYLWLWANGKKVPTNEFNLRTKPQLEEAGVSKKDVRQLYRKLRQAVLYGYGDMLVWVTHGGLPRVPSNLALVSAEQLIRGVGKYEDNVDMTWGAVHPEVLGFYQVHGHRNVHNLPVRASSTSFNLEGQVEFGGFLRVATLSKDGWETHMIPNGKYYTLGEGVESVGDLVKQLSNHPLVREKPQGGNISSFNFKKKAFYNKIWDHINVKARGLYVNTNTKEIVARGYDKFFNYGERPLKYPLAFPVHVYQKENGYLGLVGYNGEEDELYITSKSSYNSEHAEWFRQLLHAEFWNELNTVKAYLSANNACMAFEVILPEKDPHIVKYDKDQIILLDVLKRSVEFERLPYSGLQKVAHEFNFEAKKHLCSLYTQDEFASWLHSAMNDWSYHHEGFVVEDSEGYMFKVKAPYYIFWKQLRTLKGALANGKRPSLYASKEMWRSPIWGVQVPPPAEYEDFIEILYALPKEELETDIITLRDKYLII